MIEIHNEMEYDKWIIKRNSINSLWMLIICSCGLVLLFLSLKLINTLKDWNMEYDKMIWFKGIIERNIKRNSISRCEYLIILLHYDILLV